MCGASSLALAVVTTFWLTEQCFVFAMVGDTQDPNHGVVCLVAGGKQPNCLAAM